MRRKWGARERCGIGCQRASCALRWRKEQPESWTAVWTGLIGGAARTPVLNLTRDAVRVTRAVNDTDEGKRHEFILVQTRNDVAPVIHAIADSVAHIFVFAAPIMVLAAVATWFLHEVPLRESAAVEHGATVEVVPELEVVV